MTVHPVGDAHPYFPLDLHLPDYVPMQVDFDYILGVFFTAVLVVFAATWWLSGGCSGGGWGIAAALCQPNAVSQSAWFRGCGQECCVPEGMANVSNGEHGRRQGTYGNRSVPASACASPRRTLPTLT